MASTERSATTNDPTLAARVFRFNSDAQALGHFDRSHRLILLGGGVGSGKTILHGLDLIERSKHETNQLGGIFTNTQHQLEKGVLPAVNQILEMAGMERAVFDRRPPASWFRKWAREGVEIPPIARYRGVLTTPMGVHVLCGSLHNQSYHQYETIQFGWIRIEEAINTTFAAIHTMLERVRCSTGGGDECRNHHRHTRHLIFNPPRGPHPWLYAFLDQLEEAARAKYDGPPLDHRSWPLLQRGIGDAILIRSKTSDNAENLDDGYRDGLAANLSKDAARRRLDGEIIRETAGRAYTEFAGDNVRGVDYDPQRTLYLCLDFNSEPRSAVLCHPLVPDRGEYPTDYERKNVKHVGVFGEFFWADKLSDRKFAERLIDGNRGFGGDSQPRYRDDDLRGLPATWQGLRAHKGKIVAFGDAVGKHRSSHSDNLESSWDIVNQVLKQLGNYTTNIPEAGNPSPRARVDSVNGKLLNAFDVRSLWVDPRCEELIRDFEQCMWSEDGMSLREWRRGSLGTEWHRTHLSDALGYCIHRLFPLGRETQNTEPTLNLNFDAIEPPRMR